ncbi:hypothetical protein WJX81_001205 [Elliptochloris bilobata]|uniref:Tetratricopeptide repeat protein n=1 Tax=Elliptochloris bilobata TaxID=381761 RepID=A0AAW1RES9_9CHLO
MSASSARQSFGLTSLLLQSGRVERATLSLTGHCLSRIGEYAQAADTYKRLAQLCPQSGQYALHYAQALFKAGRLDDAARAACAVGGRADTQHLAALQLAIAHERADADGGRACLARLPPDAADTLAAAACLDYAAGDYASARDGFEAAADAAGMRPDLAYSSAVCHFRLGDLAAATQLAAGAAPPCVIF